MMASRLKLIWLAITGSLLLSFACWFLFQASISGSTNTISDVPFLLQQQPQYAQHYQDHFPTKGQLVKLLEIGVRSGGSIEWWRRYYGPNLTYVGVDERPESMKSQVPTERTFIEIGAHDNTTFLDGICRRYGPFNAIVDNGKHTESSIKASLLHLFVKANCLAWDGMYAVEGLQAMRLPDHDKDSWKIPYIVSNLTLVMNMFYGGEGPDTAKLPLEYKFVTPALVGIHIYTGIMFLQKGHAKPIREFRVGTDRIPYKRRLQSEIKRKNVEANMTKRLIDVYVDYQGPYLFHHYYDYAEHYGKHFPQPGKTVKLLEMGVQSGGSTRVWRNYYGPQLTYVGLDIQPKCKRSEVLAERTYVEIGGQDNITFLEEICRKYGPFDAIVDDAAHTDPSIKASLLYMFPRDECLSMNGVYAVEDLHTMRWPNYHQHSWKIPYILSNLTVAMHMSYGAEAPDTAKLAEEYYAMARQIKEMHIYDSLLYLHKGTTAPSQS